MPKGRELKTAQALKDDVPLLSFMPPKLISHSAIVIVWNKREVDQSSDRLRGSACHCLKKIGYPLPWAANRSLGECIFLVSPFSPLAGDPWPLDLLVRCAPWVWESSHSVPLPNTYFPDDLPLQRDRQTVMVLCWSFYKAKKKTGILNNASWQIHLQMLIWWNKRELRKHFSCSPWRRIFRKVNTTQKWTN